jgi:hypothetical protein
VPLRETAWATLRKFQVSSQFTQSGHRCHITEEIENLLRIFCNWLILSKLAGKFRIYSQFSVLSYSLVHCAFPGSLIKMSSPGKLGFVPSEKSQTSSRKSKYNCCLCITNRSTRFCLFLFTPYLSSNYIFSVLI